MKLRLLWFGRPAASPFEGEVERYRRRVARRWPAEDLALRPAGQGRDADPRRALRLEAEKASSSVPEGWSLIALDETGRAVTSVGFAQLLAGLEGSGIPGLAMVVGSDLGLDAELRSSAHVCLSLSPMTLPHLVARLLLWEQLFRATTILAGGAYHRAGVEA